MVLPCKNKEEGGSTRASPVAAPMPKSVSLLRGRKESLDCLVLASFCVHVRVRMRIGVQICVPFTIGVAMYL